MIWHKFPPGQDKYEILVMSSPTVDITNLTPSKMTQLECEAKIVDSCTNMLNIAKEALAMHNLKVVIMDHAPRFDSREKAYLASFANKTLHQLWSNLPTNIRENITVIFRILLKTRPD